ncbi:Abscisic acid G-protein coupled receptor-domain-containing protein [Xylogone sp. PMI_703]|nr:Abscisic acid G-protein coupled receptor-domain-containing protein [Xylogone sp. PMI_703]
MLPSLKCTEDAGDACMAPSSIRSQSFVTLVISSAPFIVTFVAVATFILYKIFPSLSRLQQDKDENGTYLPSHAPLGLQKASAEYSDRTTRRSIVALCFSTTIGLAAVLAELILCEISNSLNPAARALALKITVPTLLFSLVILIPFLEIQSVISGFGWRFQRTSSGKIPKMPWLLQFGGFSLWLMVFWWLGLGIPGTYIHLVVSRPGKSLGEACLERVGIVGISLMALLSGFAASSTIWQTFGTKQRPVTEADIARKRVGLDATNDMLAAKRSRLRALERKMSEAPKEGFMTKMIGNIRGGGDSQEIKALQMEIAGLAAMASSLSASLNILESRYAASKRASSPLGKFFITPASYGFSLYCVYRIFTTTITAFRRLFFPSPTAISSSTTDPINRMLALLAKHVDPTLDQLAWSRQISFLLSGAILLASFTSVHQTFHMLTKISPSLLYQAQANLALIIAQISATYVISNALLLRSNLPVEMRSVISDALGSPLEPVFVDRWFEGWFLLASVATTVRIWVGRKIGGRNDWDDFEDDVELGHKRS